MVLTGLFGAALIAPCDNMEILNIVLALFLTPSGGFEFISIGAQGSAADHVESFFVGTREGDADNRPRSGNEANIFSVRADDLNAGTR